jgi:hypothetical protein
MPGAWLAIGVHFGWNFAQGGIFGVAVSGLQTGGLLHSHLVGPEWLSGGAFGVGVSVLAVVVCVAAGVDLLLKAKSQSAHRSAVLAPPAPKELQDAAVHSARSLADQHVLSH